MEKIKIVKPKKSFNCPNCNRELLQESNLQKSGLVIKSKLVFLNGDGQVLCRCKECKSIVSLPLTFNKFQGSIKSPVNKTEI